MGAEKGQPAVNDEATPMTDGDREHNADTAPDQARTQAGVMVSTCGHSFIGPNSIAIKIGERYAFQTVLEWKAKEVCSCLAGSSVCFESMV